MIERIKEKTGNCWPCEEAIQWVEMFKNENRSINVAEIGVDIGATAVEIIKRIGEGDSYYYFDLDEVVEEIQEDFKSLGSKAKLIGIGNSKKYRDSYAWNLAQLFLDSDVDVKFDLVYVDGTHDFLHDAAAASVLKEMMNVDGVIIFDDIDWSHSTSPTSNPTVCPIVNELYSEKQINSCMVDFVTKCVMDTDRIFIKIEVINSNHRVAYRRIEV